jgi:hypothetical protein
MLDEAENVTRPGGYGTEQIMLNRADALRRLGRPEDARQVPEQLVALCEEWDEPTLLLFAALVDLAEVLTDLGAPPATRKSCVGRMRSTTSSPLRSAAPRLLTGATRTSGSSPTI